MSYVALRMIVFSAAMSLAVTGAARASFCERDPAAVGRVVTLVVAQHPVGASASCGAPVGMTQNVTLPAPHNSVNLSATPGFTWTFQRNTRPRDGLFAQARVLRAQAAPPATHGKDAAPARGAEGWRIETLADGRLAAIGVGMIDGVRHVVALTCGAGKRPELAIEPAARTLLVETSDGTWAFPPDWPADALAAGLLDGADAKFRLLVDGKPFPSGPAAVDAFEKVGKNCEQGSGWEYGKDDDKQMLWIFRRPDDGSAPFLTFGKPATGWLLADLSCDIGRQNLIVRSTALPRGAKNGRITPFKLSLSGQAYSASARIKLYAEGDVAGFAVAHFTQPRKLLEIMRKSDEISLITAGVALTMPMHGAIAMLPLFEQACGY